MDDHMYIRSYSRSHSIATRQQRDSALFNLKLTNNIYDKEIKYNDNDEEYQFMDHEVFEHLTLPCVPSKKGMNLMIKNYVYDRIKFYIFMNDFKILSYTDALDVERKEARLTLTCVYLDTFQYHKYVINYTLKPYCTRTNDQNEMSILLTDGNRQVYSSEIHLLDQGERNEMCKFVSYFEEILDTKEFVREYLAKHHVMLSFRLVEIIKKIKEEKQYIINIIRDCCKCFYKHKKIFRCICNNNILLVLSNEFSNKIF